MDSKSSKKGGRVSSAHKPKRNLASYKRIKELGQGAFGTVFMVECQGEETKYAIKQIDMKNMDEEEKLDVVNEIRLQQAMHHPNIVLLRESYTTKKGMKNIVMELADGDDFDSLIHDRQMTSRC